MAKAAASTSSKASGAIVSGAASKGLAPGYARSENQPGGSNYANFQASAAAGGFTASAAPIKAPTITKTSAPVAPTKAYNFYTNDKGGVNYNSFGTAGGVKTAKDLATAQADIKANNADGTYTMGDLDKPVYGTDASNLYGNDMSIRDKLASEAISTSGLDTQTWLNKQSGYISATPENQKKTFDNTIKAETNDVVGRAAAKDAIDAVTQAKKEEDFATQQQDRQLQIDRLEAVNNGIARSADLDATQKSLDAIKQSVAYMGTMGMPGVSATHLDAISKQIDQAQTTYNNLVQIQANQKAMEAIGVEYNAANFTKKMTDLHYALSQQVGAATQNAINQLTMNGNNIDSIEELNTVKGTMMQELGKSVANIALSNQTQRQAILQQYNTEIQKGEARTKNALIINEPLSKAKGMYIDGNGQPMVDANSNPIPYTPTLQTSFDQSTNTLTSRDPTNPAGTLKQTVLGSGNANIKPKTTTEMLAIINDPTLTDQQKQDMLAGKTPSLGNNTEQNKLGETAVDTGVKNVYGSNVKLAPTVAAKLKSALATLNSQGINLFIGDSYRSTAVQQQAYDKWVAGGKKGPQVAPPHNSFHELGQAIDISQSQMNDPIVEKALLDAGFTRPVASERFHWSFGEGSDQFTKGATQPGDKGDLNKLSEYLIDTQPRGQGYSDEDVKAYTKSIQKYAKAGDRPTVIQLFRNQVLKDKENSTLVKNAKFITSMVDQTQSLMKKYEQEGGDMNIFNGTVQKVIEKAGASGNNTLVQIGQNMGMLTADYIRQISGTAAADAEVARLTALLPNTTSTFNRNNLLSEGFKKRISTEARSGIEVTLGKNKAMLDEIFPELATTTPEVDTSGIGRRQKAQG